MTKTLTPRQIVDQAYEALLKNGDVDGFLAHFDENSVLVEAPSLPYGGTFKGRDAIKAAIGGVFQYYSALTLSTEVITEGDGWVIAYGTFSATTARTGKTVTMPLAEVWKFNGDKVSLLHPVYSDTKAVIDALA